MSDEAWEPFDRLFAAIEKAVTPLGITAEHWVTMPGTPKQPQRALQIVFSIGPEAFTPTEPAETDEERATREQFEKMMEMEHKFDEDQKVERAIKGLINIRKDGIFDEDDTPGE